MNINKSNVIADGRLGNGLAAASDLEAGDGIIEISNPYILVVEKASLSKVCSHCLVEAEKMQRCGRCKVPYYCSTSCQTESWRSIHRQECKILQAMPSAPPTPVRALMQILLTHSFGTAPDPLWKDLKSNQREFAQTPRWADILLQATGAVRYSKFPSNPASMELAVGVLCRMSTNAFRAMSVSNDPVGLCFEPLIALANHSCTPNAAIVFDGRKIMLRALNPIKKGEQVFISYIDNTERRATRQAELREEYFFGCGCVKCTKGDSHYSSWLKHPHDSSNPRPDRLTDPQKLESDARSATSASATMMVEGVSLEICPDFQTLLHNARNMPHQITRLKMLTEVLLLLRPFREVGRYAEPSFIAVLSDIHLLYLDGESIPSALILLIFMHLNCYAFAYPQPHHPSNVVRLFTMARLCRVMPVLLERKGSSLTEKLKPGGKALQAFVGVTDWISAAQCILIEIIELAALSHGKESRFMKEVKSELETVEKLQQLTGRGETRDKLKQWGGRGDQTVDGSGAGLEYAKKMFEALKDLGGTASAQEVMEWGLHLLPLDEQEIAAMDS